MLEFRRSLPAYKEKNALLMAILNNQVCFSVLVDWLPGPMSVENYDARTRKF